MSRDLSAHLVAQCIRAMPYVSFAARSSVGKNMCFGMEVPDSVMLEAMKISPPKTAVEKMRRAERYVEWRRSMIDKRNRRRVKIAVLCAIVPPAAIIVVSLLWRGAVLAVLT